MDAWSNSMFWTPVKLKCEGDAIKCHVHNFKNIFSFIPVIVPLLSVLICPLLIFKLNILDLVGPLC